MTRGDRIEHADGRTGTVEGFSQRLELLLVTWDGGDTRFVDPANVWRPTASLRMVST